MRPVSDRFLATVRGSHRMAVEARVVTTYQTTDDPDGTKIPVLAGDVNLDASADVRSTLDMTTDGTGWSTQPDGALVPYGNEIFIRRGIDLGGGTREWVSLGYFRIYTVEQETAPDGPLRIAARDRMAGLIDARMTTPVQFNPAHTVRQVFDRLVLEVYPSATIAYDFNPDALAVGRTIVVEEDRYAALRDLAFSLGRVLYFDHAGILQVRTAPNPTVPVFNVNAGPGGVLVSMSRSLSREGAYNGVVAVGEAPDDKPPARAVAVDTSPASPSWWHGTYGKVPRFYSSPFILTNAQAASAASEMLLRTLGLPYNVDFSTVPNPALEPLDPVRIDYRGGSEVHVIDKLTVPLTPEGAMQANTRQQGPEEIEVS